VIDPSYTAGREYAPWLHRAYRSGMAPDRGRAALRSPTGVRDSGDPLRVIEGTARHAGHADRLGERIDGAIGLRLRWWPGQSGGGRSRPEGVRPTSAGPESIRRRLACSTAHCRSGRAVGRRALQQTSAPAYAARSSRDRHLLPGS